MSWNFRVVRNNRPGGGESFTIHEAYYQSDIEDQHEMSLNKTPSGICPDPYNPLGLTLEELKRDVTLMSKALERLPVDGTKYHVRVRYERKRNKSVAEDLNREVRAARKEARDWKKAYLKANSDRITIQRELDDLRRRAKHLLGDSGISK